jgi:hypothetical protein
LTPQEAANGATKSFAEERWWDVFQDKQLKELIKTAHLVRSQVLLDQMHPDFRKRIGPAKMLGTL